ncbi:MAG: SEL1-like repeat protein [Sulfuritalea sp.]|nr:SEL1-like repeat protein [Sulfuritalea sp.]
MKELAMKSIAMHQMTRLLAATFLGTAILLSPRAAQSAEEPPARKAQSQSPAMEAQWRQLQQTIPPDIVIKLSEEFQKDYPNSRYRHANRYIQAGARKALLAQQEARLSSDALEDPTGDDAYRRELIQATRGSKDSAYRVALMYRQGTHGLSKDPQRTKQWLRVAAELGNGRASWEVANIYNRDGEIDDAAKFEAKAVRDGFRIPPRLPNRPLGY